MTTTVYKSGDHAKDLKRLILWKKQHKKKKVKKVKPSKMCKVEILTGLTYIEFLKTKYWKRVRKTIMKRDNYTCKKCGSKKILHVHHLTYKHHLKEHLHLIDLVTLCKSCHELEPNHSPF